MWRPTDTPGPSLDPELRACVIPGCSNAAVVVTIPVTVTVEDTDSTPKDGLPVYAFNGTSYTGYNGTTGCRR